MPNNRFQQQLEAYGRWRYEMLNTCEAYASWLAGNQQSSVEALRRIADIQQSLRQDQLKIAFVAEFSRGKTELINAIFFANYKRRLLPSTAGRTTMCPTEIFYDQEADESYVRLLPIETRLQETSLSELREDHKQWVHYPLETDSPQQMEAALSEIVQTKTVPIDEAKALGLYTPDLFPGRTQFQEAVEIPKWRHALISFPHPLLKQGLTIIDTPGLNALGVEPELTLNTLPSAQAVIFILGADTGVTRSDLEIWQHHIKGFQSGRKKRLAVALNKIDTLWDELRDPADVEQMIKSQQSQSAKILGLEESAVFPLSAHKGLLAKVRNDLPLLEKSGLPKLEEFLGKNVLSFKQQIIHESIGAELEQMIGNSRTLTSNTLSNTRKQLEELEELSGKSNEVIQGLMEKTRVEQAQYMRDVESFQAGRSKLKHKADSLQTTMNLAMLDKIIDLSRSEMANSWTTIGMKKAMKRLFDEIRRLMSSAVIQCEQTRQLTRSIYRDFQNIHGFSVVQPNMFSIVKYRVELELLNQEAEVFRDSPITALMEQNFVVKRFYSALVNRARQIFQQADREIKIWLSSTLEPLAAQIREHKEMMEKRLSNLQKIGQSRNTLQYRILELQEQYTKLAHELTALRNMANRLNANLPLNPGERPKPRLVADNRFKSAQN